MTLYFAYGSNLDRAQMRRRCPAARVESCATLHGYRIVFGGHSAKWDGAVATLVPAPGARVEGVLYRVSELDLDTLDRFEGAPDIYIRCGVRVWDEHGRRRRAQVYCRPRSPLRTPSMRYVDIIASAYRRFGFDLEPLVRAVQEVA